MFLPRAKASALSKHQVMALRRRRKNCNLSISSIVFVTISDSGFKQYEKKKGTAHFTELFLAKRKEAYRDEETGKAGGVMEPSMICSTRKRVMIFNNDVCKVQERFYLFLYISFDQCPAVSAVQRNAPFL